LEWRRPRMVYVQLDGCAVRGSGRGDGSRLSLRCSSGNPVWMACNPAGGPKDGRTSGVGYGASAAQQQCDAAKASGLYRFAAERIARRRSEVQPIFMGQDLLLSAPYSCTVKSETV